MTQDNTINRPPLSEWQTELIRLTAFPSPSMSVANQNWWQDLMGETPTKQNKNLKTIEQLDEGPFKSGRLILSVSPLRIDWVYRTQESHPDEFMAKLPILGSYEQVIKDFSEIIMPWFSTTNLDLSRLAFGCILLQEVDNHPNGYRLVSAYLPFDLNENNMSDFIYRINRKKQSELVSGLEINPLSTWSAIALKNLSFTLSGSRLIQQDISNSLYAARLELDINTSPDFEMDLPSEKLGRLFQELISLGTEIAKEGDVP